MREITIELERYNELLKKEQIYDLMKIEVEKDKYASDLECVLFEVEKKRGLNDESLSD